MSGMTRMSIAQWRELYDANRTEWAQELRDRPARFDRDHWRRAVLAWWNEVSTSGAPAAGDDTDDAVLRGVPIVVKDLFDVRGEQTAAGSRLGEVLGTAAGDAWLVAELRSRGALLAGRGAMNEFAYGIDGRNAIHGDCPHPFDSRRIAGGSSSGSAWAVASGTVPLALGTDTGGSIRVPAALCGVWGYRMAHETSRASGTVPLAPSCDTVGWFTASGPEMREVRAAMGLGAEQGSTSVETGAADARQGRAGAARSSAGTESGAVGAHASCRIAAVIPEGARLDRAASEQWTRAIAILRDDEHTVVEISGADVAPLGDDAYNAYAVITSSEAAEVHREWLDRYRSEYSETVWALIDRGRHWSADRRSLAEERRAAVRRTMQNLLGEFDFVVIPATPQCTPLAREATGEFREHVLRLNAPASLAGLPVLAVPLGGNPVQTTGIQCIGATDAAPFETIIAAWRYRR